jgi:hypothetical protein
MAVSADLCFDQDIPDYIQAECGTETGGVPFIAIIKTTETIDEDDLSATLESDTWWLNNINGSPSTVQVVLNTRGSKPLGTPTEEPGFGFLSVIRNGDERTLDFEAIGAVQNKDFWSKVNRKSSHRFVYGTTTKDVDGNYVAYLADNVSIYADVVIDQDVKSRLRIGGNAKWATDGTLDIPFSFPAEVIESLSA